MLVTPSEPKGSKAPKVIDSCCRFMALAEAFLVKEPLKLDDLPICFRFFYLVVSVHSSTTAYIANS